MTVGHLNVPATMRGGGGELGGKTLKKKRDDAPIR